VLDLELDFIELLVLRLETLLPLFDFQGYVSVVGVTLISGIQWVLFRYHFVKLIKFSFFIEHYDVASRFARNRYNTSLTFAMVIFPIGVSVIIYSVFTKFNTVKFIEMFGTFKSFYLFSRPNKFNIRIKP
jgi:hypothetical protein